MELRSGRPEDGRVKQASRNRNGSLFPLVIFISAGFLLTASLYSFLLFHTLVEFFAVLSETGMFVVAWFSRRYIRNNFLLLLGISYLFVGAFDLIHALTFRGIGIFPDLSLNISIQYFVAGIYLEVISLVLALLLIGRKLPKDFSATKKLSRWIFSIYSLIFLALNLVILQDWLPDAYLEGKGLTGFKSYSEYFISSLFLLAIIILFQKRKEFDRRMADLLLVALSIRILSELFLARYSAIDDLSSLLGHLLRFLAILILYKAVMESGFLRPYRTIFSELKKNEERYRSLVELSPDPIVVHSGGKIIFANGSARRMFGIEEKKEIAGEELASFFHPDYREQMYDRYSELLDGKHKITPVTEMEILRSDGKRVPVEIKAMRVPYVGKSVIESVMRDVSRRKAAERRIRSLAKFPEENPSPVLRVLADGTVQYANRPAREMLALFGWRVRMLLPENLFVNVRSVLENNERYETEIICPSGKIFSLVFVPITNDNWVNVYGKDITERKHVEKLLLEVQTRLRKSAEEQLAKSYEYLGLVNRKISLLLEIDKHSQNRRNKQEIMDYVVSSACSLAYAKTALLYIASGKNHFNLVSSFGLEDRPADIQMVSADSAGFIQKMLGEKRRVNGPHELNDFGCFDQLNFSYFVSLPILQENACSGFLFLGFSDRKSMDVQDIQFLDVFSKHVTSALLNSGIIRR